MNLHHDTTINLRGDDNVMLRHGKQFPWKDVARAQTPGLLICQQNITDLFARQQADATLSRSEALRLAMMALLDGKGFTDDSGKTLFTYAHPLFWAPYTIIGDGR